ncbi:MAG: YbhN family protein [Patescibacteria group bacterium]
MNLKATGKRIITLACLALSLYYIGRVVMENWQAIGSTMSTVNAPWLILGLTAATGTLAFQSFIWHRLLKHFNATISFRDTYATYFQSLITRYIPGGIWNFISRAYLTSRLGFAKTQVLFLTIAESILTVVSGSALFLIIRPTTTASLQLTLLSIILILASVVALAMPNIWTSIYRTFFKKEIAITKIPWRVAGYLSGYFIILWLANGLALLCLIRSIGGSLPSAHFLPLIAYYAMSWIIGFIILVVPSGLGVRETLFITLAGALVGAPIAIISAVLFRLVLVAAELINFFLSALIRNKIQPHDHDSPRPH